MGLARAPHAKVACRDCGGPSESRNVTGLCLACHLARRARNAGRTCRECGGPRSRTSKKALCLACDGKRRAAAPGPLPSDPPRMHLYAARAALGLPLFAKEKRRDE